MLVDENIYFLRGIDVDSNSYLVLGEENIIIDTGTGQHIDGLISAITAHAIKLGEMDLILNTHCHYDHIGGNEVLKQRSNAEVAAHKLAAHYIEFADKQFTCATNLNPVEVEQPLNGGDKIADFEVLHTPGHTQGSICLYNPESKILISGDTIFGDAAIGRTDMPGGDIAQLKKSLELLSKLKIEKILPGHGAPCLENGNAVIEQALDWVSQEPLL